MRRIWRSLKTLAGAGVCWAALYGPALAQPREEPTKPGGATAWIAPYGLVLLGIALGMMLVCRSSRRRDRAKPDVYHEKKLVEKD